MRNNLHTKLSCNTVHCCSISVAVSTGEDDVFGSYHAEGEGQAEEEGGVFGRGSGLFSGSGGGGGMFDELGEEEEEEEGRGRGRGESESSATREKESDLEASISSKKGGLSYSALHSEYRYPYIININFK